MRADQKQVDPAQFRIDTNGQLVDDKSGQPIADYPYMVFRVEVSKQRDDWFLIPDVAAAHKALRDEIRGGALSKINDAFAAFRRTAVSCPDLLLADAQRLVTKVDQDVKAAVGPAPTASTTGIPIRDLRDIRLYN
jgi:hypothetical protein